MTKVAYMFMRPFNCPFLLQESVLGHPREWILNCRRHWLHFRKRGTSLHCFALAAHISVLKEKSLHMLLTLPACVFTGIHWPQSQHEVCLCSVSVDRGSSAFPFLRGTWEGMTASTRQDWTLFTFSSSNTILILNKLQYSHLKQGNDVNEWYREASL